MERRRSPRVQCQLPCEIQRGRDRAEGTVLDMSEGGLCVRTPLSAQQGEPVRVRIEGLASPLEVEALVWHARLVRRRDTREPCRVLGLMLSKAPEPWFELIPRAPLQGEPPAAGELRAFRIRVKHCQGPRTRILSLSAESEDEARSLAADELKGEWDVLEVVPA